MSLTVKDLTKRYGDRTVVDRLSFEMPGPGVYALLGTNGAGKTTRASLPPLAGGRNTRMVVYSASFLSRAVSPFVLS